MLTSRASEPLTLAPKCAAMRRAVEHYNPKETPMTDYLSQAEPAGYLDHQVKMDATMGRAPQISLPGMPGQLEQLTESINHIEDMTSRLESFATRLAGCEALIPKPSNGAVNAESVGHRLQVANSRLAESRARLSQLVDQLEGVA